MIELDPLLDEAATAIERAAAQAYADYTARVLAGEAPIAAAAAVQAGFSGATMVALSAAFSRVLERSVGVTELRALPVGEVTLSTRLHQQARATAAEVARRVREHAAGQRNATALARELYEGYARAGADPLPIKKLPLRRELRELLTLSHTDPRSRAIMLMLERQVRGQALRTAPLAAAYQELFDAAIKGASQRRLDATVRAAIYERNRYFANRIAQTELARAYWQQAGADFMADPAVEVLQWRINPTHPREDICFRIGTPIITARGPVRIEQVQLGDLALTHRGRWMPVVRLYRSSVAAGAELIEIRAQSESGKCHRATMTPNHPVLTSAGWTPAGDLQTGSRVALAASPCRCRQPADDAAGTAPSGSDRSSQALGLRNTFWQRCGELLGLRPSRTARSAGRGAATPIGEHRSAGRTCLRHRARPASSGFLHACAPQTAAAETPACAGTFQVCGCHSSGCCCLGAGGTSASSTSVLGQQAQRLWSMLGRFVFGRRPSNTSAPVIASETEHRTLSTASGSWPESNIIDGMIVGVRSTISQGEAVFNLAVADDHSYVAAGIVVHNCDLLAHRNAYGLGPGLYPKAKAPRPPAHPFCKCRLISRPDLVGLVARERTGADREYLRGLPTREAAAVMGSRGRLQAVLKGEDALAVVNRGRPAGYRIEGLGGSSAAQSAAMSDAYESAKNGGPHSMWLVEQRALGVRQLQSAERSLWKQVRLHEGWIAAPGSKVHDWATRDTRYQDGLLKKWQQDQKRQREQIDIVRGVLREKESENG